MALVLHCLHRYLYWSAMLKGLKIQTVQNEQTTKNKNLFWTKTSTCGLFILFVSYFENRIPLKSALGGGGSGRVSGSGGGGSVCSLAKYSVCSICACLDLSVSSSSWGLGRAAVCDCGTPWTFLLAFFFFFFFFFFFAYDENQSNRVSDFRDFVWSLFPKAILFDFYSINVMWCEFLAFRFTHHFFIQ